MKLVYISAAKLPSTRANGIQILKMCQAFSKNGAEVTLVSPHIRTNQHPNPPDTIQLFDQYGIEAHFPIRWVSIPNIPGKSIFLIFRTLRILKDIRPEIVYGRYVMATMFSVIFGWKTVFESHCPVWEIGKFQFLFYRRMLALPRYIGTIFISGQLKALYEKKIGDTLGHNLVAHDASDKVEPDPKKWAEGEPMNVGYIGSLSEGKGINIILGLAKSNPDVNFIVVGGSDEEISQLKKVSTLNITWKGYKHHKEVKGIYSRIQVALLPNQNYMPSYGSGIDISDYNSPLKLFEYMAHGLSVISSDIKVLREVLNESVALFAAPDDLDSWNRSLNLLKDESLRIQLGQSAKELFDREYTWSHRASRILNFIKEVEENAG